MKKFTLFVFSLVIIYSNVQADEFAGGSGTSADPFIVSTADHLNNVRNYLGSTHLDKYFKQMADIDLGVAPWNEGEGWVPVGTSAMYFFGNYDGNNFVVKNMVINRHTNQYQGLFGYINGTISNLGVVDASVTDNGSRAGILAGLNNAGTISNCYTSGTIQTSSVDGRIGGLTGWNNKTIIDSYSTARVISTGSINGGLTGANSGSTASVINCFSTGQVTGVNNTGGLVGTAQSASVIKNSFSAGDVISGGNGTGGLAGIASNNVVVENSYACGAVSGVGYVGGLVGNVSNSLITNCYSTGFVTGDSNTGGLLGYLEGLESTISNSYWNIESSGQNSSAGGEGKNNAEMISQVTFNTWDFIDTWNINEGITYPYLLIQGTPGSFNYPPQYTPPANLHAVLDGIAVSLSWNVPSIGTPDSYKVYRDGSFLANVTGQTVYSDNTVVNYTVYNYFVTAIFGTEESNHSNTAVIYFFPGFAGGDGTEENPFLVSDPDQLNAVRYNISSFFQQTANINLGISPWNEGEGWVPVMNFTGNYNGKGFIIDGLFINKAGKEFQGLFGYTTEAVLDSVNLENVNITGFNLVGALSGRADNTVIRYCSSSGSVNSSGNKTGGLVGMNYYGTALSDCYSTATIETLGNAAGGLCGTLEYYSNLSDSYATGTVTGKNNLGGLVGVTDNQSNVSGSYATGNVTGTDYLGGLTSACINYSNVKTSYSTGNVIGQTMLGGMAGNIMNSSSLVNSYSTGNVTASQGTAGGLAGRILTNSFVANCYSKGSVSGLTDIGGLVGVSDDVGRIYGSFWDTQTSGQGNSAGGTGVTTAEMKTLSTFAHAAWDFKEMGIEEIWNIGNERNNGYPYLDWQYPGDPAPTGSCSPIFNTIRVTDITENTITIVSTIYNTGNPKAAQHGVCWSTSGTPDINDNKTEEGAVTDAGDYNSMITGLVKNTTYHARAYVTQNSVTYYGRTISFITSSAMEGNGTPEDPYKVASLGHLFRISSNDTLWDKHFIQTIDIVAGATYTWNEGEGWNPIGNVTKKFTGSYDGNGYGIMGLYIKRQYSNHIGIFGYTNSANISNLELFDINIKGNSYVGGLVGYNNNSTFYNCTSSGYVNGMQHIGGLAGYNANNALISNCNSSAGLTGGSFIGGIAGFNHSASKIINSYSTGQVQGDSHLGGLVGYNNASSSLINCFSNSLVAGKDGYLGGLAGFNNASAIDNCYSNGLVQGQDINTNYMGGLVGYNQNSKIANSYSRSDLENGNYVGGLVGSNISNSSIINCYSSGNVTANGTAGGLIAENLSSNVNNSFWDKGTSDQTTSAGGTGKTTEEMKNIATYTSTATPGLDEAWDFIGLPNNDAGNKDYWGINASVNSGYPYLVWQYCASTGGEVHPCVDNPIFAPEILNHPQNQTICQLTGTSFQVDPVNVDAATTYKWEMKSPTGSWIIVSGSIFSGINTRELILTGTTIVYNNYSFRCVLSNICGPPAVSDAAILTVVSAPAISTHPAAKSICEGQNTSMNVIAAGYGTLQYRWKKGGGFITDWSASSELVFEEVSLSAAGDYVVVVKDGCGNTEESNSATLTVNPKPAVSLDAETHLCTGESMVLDPGSGYSSYLWSTGATTRTIEIDSEGTYTVTVTSDKNCSNQTGTLAILDPDIPVVSLGSDVAFCLGETELIDAGDQYDGYLWSTGATTSSITVGTTGTYWVEVKQNLSVCVKRDTVLVNVLVPYEDEEICMVLIDPETEKNMIIWEKTVDVNTMNYQVFKKSGTIYTLVGERMFADSAWVIDYNSNPASQAEAYVLVTVDNCGNASAMSKWHKPFLLQSSLGFDVINLSWEPYLIDGSELVAPDVHIFRNIDIFRGTTSTSLEKIGSITAGIGSTSYNDFTAPQGVKVYYRIGGEKDPPCNPNNLPLKKASAGPFVHSFSNLEDNQRTTGTGNDNFGDAVLIYPNPMSDRAIIQVRRNYTLPVYLRISDLSGRVIRETMHNEHVIELDRGNLSSGAYIVEVRGEMVYKGVLMVR